MTRRALINKLPKALLAYPFQYIIAVVFTLAAVNLLFGYGNSPTLKAMGSSQFFFYGWILMSLIGSPLILIGMTKSANTEKIGSILQAHRLEKLGLILQGTATLVFGLIIVYLAGSQAILSCIMYLALTVAYAVKMIVLNRKETSLRNLADTLSGFQLPKQED